nr:hypothetical protein [Tanacetum cinerariifolium]
MSQFGQITHTHMYEGEGLGTPTEPYHTPSPEVQQTLHTTHSLPRIPSVCTVFIPHVTSTDTPPIRQYTRRTRIAQSSVLLPIADEPASPLRDVSQGKACLTDSGFIADQDRATLLSPLPCPMIEHQGLLPLLLMRAVEINRLKARVKLLEDREGVAAERSRDDAPIKGKNLDGEAATERVSDDTEEIATVLTSMDATIVLASGVAGVPTGSGSIPTASPPATEVPIGSDVVPTASLVFATATVVTPYRRRNGKEVMVESKTLKKQKVQEQIDAQVSRELEEQLEREHQRMSEQIARDTEVAKIYVEEELQIMIDGLDRSNETVAKYLHEYQQFASELPLERRIELISDLVRYQENYAKVHKFQTQQRKPWSKKQKRDYYMVVIRSNLGWKVKDFRGMSFKEIKAKFTTVWKQLEDFIPIGSKEEAEREDLNQLWDLVKESLSNRQPTSDKEMELWVELKRLYELDDEDQLWTYTQNFMHAPVEWKLYDMRIVGNKMHKAFPLLVIEFPLAEEVLTASEESFHCQKKRDATAKRIALLIIMANLPPDHNEFALASEVAPDKMNGWIKEEEEEEDLKMEKEEEDQEMEEEAKEEIFSKIDQYLGVLNTNWRSETREHYELKQRVSTLEDQMRGLMLKDREEKERLKKKLKNEGAEHRGHHILITIVGHVTIVVARLSAISVEKSGIRKGIAEERQLPHVLLLNR